jgi:LDH2 family malate/lactate/ureidoglycolate dehydrogenase
MIPGAPENASREKRTREGFMVPGAILERIWTVAAERQLDLGPFIVG